MKDPYIQRINFVFYNEQMIRRKIYETRRDPPKSQLLVKPSNVHRSDPVGNQAIRNMMKLREIVFDNGSTLKDPETWIEVIEKTYAGVKELTSKIARLYYQCKNRYEICSRYGVNPHTYYDHLNRFKQFAMMQAVLKNLI